jgi:hypothetical protein
MSESVITLTERPGGAGGANASVSFDHGPEYPITLSDPFTDKQERELEWYFEEHLRFPFIDQVRAREAADSIKAYGEALFQQVFGAPQVYAVYQQRLLAGIASLRFEIQGSPEFNRLHWEALKDPALPRAFALEATMVRKHIVPPPLPAALQPSPTLKSVYGNSPTY